MVSQTIMIAIVVGVFFAGLGVGYAVLQSTVPGTPIMMTNQQMQQMMNDPQLMNQWQRQMANNPQAMNQWMNTMMQDPQLMNQWMGTMMNDPRMMQQMHNMMLNDPQHMNQMMQPMMNTMMNDPDLQQQMLDMMMNNQQMMDMMMSRDMVGGQMMHSEMMDGNMMMGQHMMGSTVTEQDDVLLIINNIESILDQVSANYGDGNQDIAFSLATNAYLENYEYIESAIAQKDRPLMEKIELMMRVDLRSMIKNGDSIENVDMKINSIKSELNKVKSLF